MQRRTQTSGLVREDVDALEATGCIGGGAVPSRARPMGDRSCHQGRPRHPGVPTRPHDPQGQPGDRRWGRVPDVGRRGDEVTMTWLDERRRPDEAIERESSRLADLLGRDLRLSLIS